MPWSAPPYPLRELIAWLDRHLRIDGVRDYGPNGLQVEGSQNVQKVATGVTSNLAFIEAAAAWGADLVVVHHGIFWDGGAVRLVGAHGRRVRALVDARISLAAYHLPLDAHPEVGNAAQLAARLDLGGLEPAFEHRGIPVGTIGTFTPPLARDAFIERVRERVNPDALVFPHGPDPVERVGLVTGGAARDVQGAIDAGCDAYLTGEAGEYSQATAEEEGITFVAAGHHRTERFGPQALGRALAAAFDGLEVKFIDVDNPV